MANATLYIQLVLLHGGKLCYTNFEYQALDVAAQTNDAFTAVNDWYSSQEATLLDCLSEQALIQQVNARHLYTGGIGQTVATITPATTGVVTGEALPRFNTASFIKYADPAGQVGSDPNLIVRGRGQLAGVPESFQNNGIFNSTAVNAYNLWAADVLAFTSDSELYEMHIFRRPPGGGSTTKNARVASMTLRRAGTQNTRK